MPTALPAPGFELGRTLVVDVDELPYPTVRTPHRARRNENPRRRWSLRYQNMIPQDYTDIRNAISETNAAGLITVPAVVSADAGAAFGYRYLPNSLRLGQPSKMQFTAELVIEELIV